MALFFDGKKIYVGDHPKFIATFTDTNDVPTDPTTVTFKIRTRYISIITSYVFGTDSEVTKSATGVYTARIPIVSDGLHYIRVESDATFGAAYEDEFLVQLARFS